jgi:hypothetical protein
MLESIVVVGLATFGLTYLICYTDGPKDLFKKIRILAGIEYLLLEDGEEVYNPPTKFFAKLLACHWCTGTWLAILLSITYVYLFSGDYISLIWLIPGSLGISGILCEEVIK